MRFGINTLTRKGKLMNKEIEVNLLEEREDGYHAYCVIFSKGMVEELKKLTLYREMNSVEETIESSLMVEIEAMY